MRRWRRAAAAVLGAGLLSACTLPGDDAPEATVADARARPGGTFTVAITPPTGLDPAYAADPVSTTVASLLCDTLVVIDPATGELRPGLADSWVVSDGGRSLQIKLGRRHVFADGTRVDSRAVVRSLTRLADPATASPVADLVAPVLGYKEFREAAENGDLQPALFVGARVIEPYSLEIVLDAQRPEFVRTLAHPATAPVQTAAAEQDPRGFARSPVCSGPYVLAAPHRRGATSLVLRRSPSYAGGSRSSTAEGRGWADEVVLRVVADEAAGYAAWERGEADVAVVPDRRVGEARAAHGPSVASAPNAQVEFVGVTTSDASPWRDVRVRRALSAALDRPRLVRDVYGDSRLPATGFVSPAAGAAFRQGACRFDPPSGPVELPTTPLKLYFNDEFHHRALAEAVAAQWRQALGIVVEPVPLNWQQFLAQATSGTGFDGAFRMSWTPPQPDPVAYVRPIAHSTASGSTNLARFTAFEIDAMLDEDVAKATDEADRVVHVQRVEDELCHALPLIPVAFGQANVAFRADRVGSARADGRLLSADGRLLLRDLFVQPRG